MTSVTVGPDDQCQHGFTAYHVSTFDRDGVTACCGAQYSVFTDDGSLYCKCCYGSVAPGSLLT